MLGDWGRPPLRRAAPLARVSQTQPGLPRFPLLHTHPPTPNSAPSCLFLSSNFHSPSFLTVKNLPWETEKKRTRPRRSTKGPKGGRRLQLGERTPSSATKRRQGPPPRAGARGRERVGARGPPSGYTSISPPSGYTSITPTAAHSHGPEHAARPFRCRLGKTPGPWHTPEFIILARKASERRPRSQPRKRLICT